MHMKTTTITVQTPEGIQFPLWLASPVTRFLAWSIDIMCVSLLTIIVTYLLFSVAMLARRVDVEAEGALERTNHKFRARFAWIEDSLRREGVELDTAGLEKLEALWAEAKRVIEP